MRVGLRVHGRVQGVGYRRFAEREALALGLRGWVRNREDGSVELEVHGDPDAIAQLRARLARGPRFAAVRTVDQTDLPAAEPPDGFHIRREPGD